MLLARRVEVAGLDLNLTALVQRGLGVLAILIGALIVYRIGKTVIGRSAKAKYPRPEAVEARAATTRGLLVSIWKYVVILGVLIAFLALLPATLAQAITVAAVAGVIVALTANALLKDVVAGFSILLEGQLAVGDRVRLFGVDVEGVVEGVGLRITVIREDDGSRVFVPNGAITAIRALAGEVAGKAEEEKRPRSTRGGRSRTRTSRPRRTPAKAAQEDTTPETESSKPPPITQEAGDSAFEVRGRTERSSESPDKTESAESAEGTGSQRPRSGDGRRRGGSRRPPRSRPEASPDARKDDASSEGAAEPSAGAGDEAKPERPQRPQQAPKPEKDTDDVLTESPWSIE